MKAWAIIGILIVAAALAACAAAPGMKMTEPAKVTDGPVVRVTPITLELLNGMEATDEFRVRKVAEEFAVKTLPYVIGVGDVLQITSTLR